MAVRRIVERVTAPFAGSKVDRAAGVIYGVLICGPESANGNDYDRDSFGDGGQYKGRHVYLNHGRERRAEDKAGWFGDDVRFRADGMPEGDFHVLKSHPMAERLFEAAERNPGLFGFSHVALCDTAPGARGRTRVRRVERVESVDLVAEPATTRGLFEGKAVPTTIKALAETLAPRLSVEKLLRLKRLSEMDGMGDVAVADPGAAAAADPDQAIDDAFASAMHAQVDAFISGDLDLPKLISKLKELAKAHGNVSDGGDGEGGGKEGEPTPESKKADFAALTREAIEVCRKVGFKGFEADDLEAIADAPPARRESLARKLMAAGESAGAEKPRSSGRAQPAWAKESRDGQPAPEEKPLTWQD